LVFFGVIFFWQNTVTCWARQHPTRQDRGQQGPKETRVWLFQRGYEFRPVRRGCAYYE